MSIFDKSTTELGRFGSPAIVAACMTNRELVDAIADPHKLARLQCVGPGGFTRRDIAEAIAWELRARGK